MSALSTTWATLTGTTAEKLAAINALMVVGPVQPVPIVDVVSYMREVSVWLPIRAAAAASPPNEAAAAAVDLNTDPRTLTIDFTLPIVVEMMAMLVSSALITQAQSNAIVAMGAATIPWWQANGFGAPLNLNVLAANGGLS
jgi:hypothetical protein